MLSEDYIMNIIRAYAKTPHGKAQIKKKYGIDYKGEGEGKRMKKADLPKYGEQMKQILYSHIHHLIKSITLEDIIVGAPTKDVDNQWKIDISFRTGALERDSLVPGKRLNNIVILFTKGYHASKYAHGKWNIAAPGAEAKYVYVQSKKDREGNDFLQQAVNQFNAEFGDIAKAELGEVYRNAQQ